MLSGSLGLADYTVQFYSGQKDFKETILKMIKEVPPIEKN